MRMCRMPPTCVRDDRKDDSLVARAAIAFNGRRPQDGRQVFRLAASKTSLANVDNFYFTCTNPQSNLFSFQVVANNKNKEYI